MVSHRDPSSVSLTSLMVCEELSTPNLRIQTYYGIAVRGKELNVSSIDDGPVIGPNSQETQT
jgi:hypothetical protein